MDSYTAPKERTLDDLAATSPFFSVPLARLRRERELDWEALEIAEAERPAALEQERNRDALRLIAWCDALDAVGYLTPDNAEALRYQILDLYADTSTGGDAPQNLAHPGDSGL